MTAWARALVTAVLLAGVLSGCGDDPIIQVDWRESTNFIPTVVPAAPGLVTTRHPATVLDDGHGAELCVGGVADSYPPHCGGPPLVGWDWSAHEGNFEESNDVRWGDFLVTGTFDGTSVTPTSVVPADEAPEPDYPDDDLDTLLATPCDEPEGGWGVTDLAKATNRSMDATFRAAEKLPGYADAWVDQSPNPASDAEDVADVADQMNDPTKLIINVRVTQDVEGAEKSLRTRWGGALCVSEARFSDADLEPIQEAMGDLPGFTGSSRGRDQVEATVLYDDGSIQAWANSMYGDGVVVVGSALQDVTD